MHTARVRHWLRLLLLCSAFSAVHMPLGAWVVSTLSQEPAVQICTPNGPQWVVLEEGDRDGTDPAAADQACVWAVAHVAICPFVRNMACTVQPGTQTGLALPSRAPAPGDRVRRVLLMSAMRAPPAPLA